MQKLKEQDTVRELQAYLGVGRAIAAHLTGRTVRTVSIGREGDSKLKVEISDPTPSRDDDEEQVRIRVRIFSAGSLAKDRRRSELGLPLSDLLNDAEGTRSDRDPIADLVSPFGERGQLIVEEERERAETVVMDHWDSITELADLLLAKGSLTRSDFAAFLKA